MHRLILTVAVASAIGILAAPPPKGPAKKGPPPAKKGNTTVVVQQPRYPGDTKRTIITHNNAKPAPKVVRRDPPRRIEASHRKFNQRGAGVWSTPPSRVGFHANRPHGARFWGRPAIPPPMAGALRAWTWVATPWNYTVDGVYYYGEGYYFDGYNYCYNGGYHLTPPPVLVTTPVVTTPVVTTPVVTTPVVTTPVVTTPVVAPPPPPPPPRRRGLLGILFGD